MLSRLAGKLKPRLGLRRIDRAVYLPPRLLTARYRAGPNFLMLGAQRAGTTFLYTLLARHPGFLPPLTKEVHWFDLHPDKPERWYRAHFPLTASLRRREDRLGSPVVTGECSPYYMFHPMVPQRVARFDPGLKLIMLLRDPVERAISHYHLSRRRGKEMLPVEEAFEREAERLAGEAERIVEQPGYVSFSHEHHSYTARGRYLDQIRAWQRSMPAEQLLLIKGEDMFRRPQATLDRVCDFLGLPHHPLDADGDRNAVPRDEVRDGLRRHLRQVFERPNRVLLAATGIGFGMAD